MKRKMYKDKVKNRKAKLMVTVLRRFSRGCITRSLIFCTECNIIGVKRGLVAQISLVSVASTKLLSFIIVMVFIMQLYMLL